MRALALLFVLVGVYLTSRWFLRQPRSTQVQTGLFVIALGSLLLVATGRLPWPLGIIVLVLPLLLAVRGLRQSRLGGRRQGPRSSGGQSVVETRFLRMTLDHETGEMSGRVLAGRLADQTLDALSKGQLVDLLSDFSDDEESAALLRAYLDRTFGDDWQEPARDRPDTGGLFHDMTRREAYAILGVEEGASNDEIVAAHGRLIQRLHPDRGGSTFLAAKINQARDLLLGA